MFNVDGIRQFHFWTHACLTLVLDHLSTIPAGDYIKEVPGFGIPTLRQQVIHIFNCEGFWISTIQALPFQDRDPADYPSVSDARFLQREVGEQTHTYLSGLADEQLTRTTEMRYPDGNMAVRTPAFILHHVLTHAFHHKARSLPCAACLGIRRPTPI